MWFVSKDTNELHCALDFFQLTKLGHFNNSKYHHSQGYQLKRCPQLFKFSISGLGKILKIIFADSECVCK